MRASIYNAMPIEGVEKLVEFMEKFEAENVNAWRRVEMFKYHCLNPIAEVGLEKFTGDYEKTGLPSLPFPETVYFCPENHIGF
mgnify:CR=1 FL=1